MDPANAKAASKTRFIVLGFGVALAGVTYLDRVCISITGAFSNLMLGASWDTCIDIGGGRTGLIGGGILSPIIPAQIVSRFSNWSAPLYLTGLLYTMEAVAWRMVDASRPLWPEEGRKG